jgi:hypothetical protein
MSSREILPGLSGGARFEPSAKKPFDTSSESEARRVSRDSRKTTETIVEAMGRFDPTITSVHDLGYAWAGNTINTAIFRHHGILTHDGIQTTAFYVNQRTLRFVQRSLSTEELECFDLYGEYKLGDAHNGISIGVDRSGYLHVCYDHHATRLRYRRSLRPNSIAGWTDELPMTGKAEDKVTYPTFIVPRQDFPLTLLYRDGIHDRGSARMKTYDEASRSWADRPVPILSGAEMRPWTSNAYWNHPSIGRDGSLHLSFVWRTATIGDEQRVNNVSVCYARSFDNGISWETSRGRPLEVPITQVNAEVVHPVSPGSNLMNQCSMAVDKDNRPHIVFYVDDKAGVPQYHYLRLVDGGWRVSMFSARTKPFVLRGGGTLQIPISRPEIVLDSNGCAFAIYRSDEHFGRMVSTRLHPIESTDCESTSASVLNDRTRLIWWEDLGFAEPVVDRSRWEREQKLTMLIQRNSQPDGDRYSVEDRSRVWLVDYRL